MTIPSFTNTGRVMYDYAITGLVDGVEVPIPFLAGQSKDYPYVRESEKGQRDQVDFSAEPGEQSLVGWWYRSQSSFDLGTGIEFMDSASDSSLSRRFNESCGVNVLEAGKAYLLRHSTLAESVTGSKALVSYSNSGEEGVLHAHGNVLSKITSAGTVTSVTWGGTGTILALCTDGGNYYAVGPGGLYRGALPGGAGTKIYDYTGMTRGAIAYAKDRLLLCLDEKVYEITDTDPASPQPLPDPLSEGPANGWTWTAIASGPDAVFMSGYAGDYSAIYAVTMDTSSAVPTLAPPIVAQEMPRGEVATTIETYMGTYIAVGSTRGVRIGMVGSSGRIDLGPLSVKSDLPVYSIMGLGEYLWAGGSVTPELGADGLTVTNRYGLYKTSLSNNLPDSNGDATSVYAYARDLYYDGATAATSKIVGIAPVGQTDRVAFAIDGIGVVMEDATTLVPRGYLTTGRIRMDTWEDKLFAFLRVASSVTDGRLTTQWRGEDTDWATLYSWNTDDVRRVDTEASDRLPHLWVQYRFILTRGDASLAHTPVLTGYQVRSQPSGVVMRNIRLVLQCSSVERTTSGLRVERETWSRIEALEAAESRGGPVLYQDLGTGESSLALIEKCQFVVQNVPSFPIDRGNPGGLLLVTLRKVT